MFRTGSKFPRPGPSTSRRPPWHPTNRLRATLIGPPRNSARSLFVEQPSRSIFLFERDLRANASRLSRTKTDAHSPDHALVFTPKTPAKSVKKSPAVLNVRHPCCDQLQW